MNRKEYLISQNQTIKFIQSNEAFIYIIEIPKNSEIIDEQNNTIKDISYLSSLNSHKTLHLKNDAIKEKKIYVTSVANNIEISFTDKVNGHSNYLFPRNGIIFFYSKENEEKILNLDSFENSFLFYYYKYDYNSITPRDLNPINKSLFTKSKGTILTLDEGSIYIIFCEIYKFDFDHNILDFFISPKHISKNIVVEYDRLYLEQSNDFYNISFHEGTSIKLLKLSKKTNDSIIKDTHNNIILSGNNHYYELTEDNLNSGIQLKITNSDCFIEILLSSKENSEILDDYSKENYKLTKIYTIIKIPKIKTKYELSFTSKNEKKLTELKYGIMNGISKNSYFYLNTVPISYNTKGEEYAMEYKIPYFYNLEMEDDEFQICQIYLNKEQLQNDIFLSYNPVSIYNNLLKPIDRQKSEYIIGNISSILDKFYIYKEIAKKPPRFENLENYEHKPIDFIESVNNISKINQTHLSLFQDIHRILNSVRDGHLSIKLQKIENNIDISKYWICIPFKFYIETDKNGNPKVKMTFYNGCSGYNRNLLNNFIEAHKDIPLKFINKTDPFEYFQNFGKYQLFKSKHAHFSLMLIKLYDFDIQFFPYDYSDLSNIEYEFENGDIFIYDYILDSNLGLNDIDQKEFDEFYQSLKNEQSNVYLIPNIVDAKRLFMKKKGILFGDKDSNNIVWDLSTKEGNLKCRIDNKNKYNVFLQSSFNYDSKDNAIEVMINCSKLFYSNNYKIIGIENKNGGGKAVLFEIWHQLIQQKILDKSFNTLIKNKKAFEFFKKENIYPQLFANTETCKNIGDLDELEEIYDDYGYSDEFKQNIIHNRTKIPVDFLDKSWKKRLEKIRKENIDKKNYLKKATDILIFTDPWCFSGGSYFIKAFQNKGGAIIVGFSGNPKLGIDEFDASQSPSPVQAFQDKEFYYLQSLGYKVGGITFAESFDDSYQEPNPIPREYLINLVDERVPIYSSYSDDLYNDFINKANEIFKKYETKCNKNNPRLLLDDDNCLFNGSQKGGHPCGEDGQWDMSKCEPYYCELGYYFDQIKKQCVLDICTNGNESIIYLDDEIFNKTTEYELEPDNEIVFNLKDDSYFYFFEADNDNIFTVLDDYTDSLFNTNINNKSKFYMVEYKKNNFFDFEINVNYFKTLKEKTKIKLTAIKKETNISIKGAYKYITLNEMNEKGFIICNEQNNLIYSYESDQEHILYFNTFNKDLNIYYTLYNSNIEPKDIIHIDKKKFSIVSNKLLELKKNDIGILILQNQKNYSYVTEYIYPKNIDQDIIISNNRFIYLSKKDFVYNLRLYSVTKNIFIKLNSETLNAEIEIIDGKNSLLNKNNRYYFIDKNIKDVSLKLKNDNSAFIEFLYEYEFNKDNNLDINKKKFELTKGLYTLKYKKSDKIKSILLDLESNNELKGYIFSSIGKYNYSNIFPSQENLGQNNTKTEFILPDDKIDDDEDFVIFIKMNSDFNLTIENKKESGGNNDEDNNDDKFPIWAIILIVVLGSIILLGIIFIIVRKFKRSQLNININEKETLLQSQN